jgi:PAS domain S-box-containing protein
MKSILYRIIAKPDAGYDLHEWRDWLSDILSLILVVALPLAYVYIFPVFIAGGHYYLVFIDLFLWVILAARVFVPGLARYIHNGFWIIILYVMAVSFYIMLGPHYARSAWMVLCTVMAADFFGIKGSLFSTGLNVVILSLLYHFHDRSNPAWVAVTGNGPDIWIMYVASLSLISIASSLPVGFLIGRLDRSLLLERHIREELQAANEELGATNEELEAMNEEFEAQNRELIGSSAALRASELEMKEIFNSSHDAFIIHDREGRILDVNRRMLDMYGMTREEALSLGVADISSPDTDPALGSRYMQRVMAGEELLFEWKAFRPGGKSAFDVEVGLKKLTWRGREVVLASVRDLTERKNAEAERERVRSQLVQAQKMEAVGTLAGGIAHDFNNVLGGIMGSHNLLDLMLKKERLDNHEKIFKYLETAMESSRRAADMTRQLLTLSRKSELRKTAGIIQNSLDNVKNIYKNSFPKSVDLDFRCGGDPLQVHADPTQIEQALLNLCVNASHAMTLMRGEGGRHGGRLTVEARLIHPDHEFRALHGDAVEGGALVVVSVEDTGVGMVEEVRGSIFDPFFTTKSQEDGTGLGLAITYSIVKQHGGFIDVDSEPGRGSIFRIYLPLMTEVRAGMPDSAREIVRGTGRILVVDDEETLLRVAMAMLEQCGYEVITAGNAEDGIRMYEQEHSGIRAVVLDTAMPGKSGLEVYEAMKAINPGVRVLLCSGFMDTATMEKAREMGLRVFINKPYSLEELSRKISEVLV